MAGGGIGSLGLLHGRLGLRVKIFYGSLIIGSLKVSSLALGREFRGIYTFKDRAGVISE